MLLQAGVAFVGEAEEGIVFRVQRKLGGKLVCVLREGQRLCDNGVEERKLE